MAAKKYECEVCGHIHEGEFPKDYLCPVCGVDSSHFKEVK
jgi:rubredoxin